MAVQSYLEGSTAVKIAESVEKAVAKGKLAPGERLPPVRQAARQLGVAAATVAAAYRLLQERGIAAAERRLGTRIREASPLAAPAAVPLPEGVRNLADGNPDPALLPDLLAALRHVSAKPRLYGGQLNHPPLLRIARELFAADGVPSDCVAVAGGALDGIDRVLREHLRAGDRVLVEDPVFAGVADLVHSLGLTPVPVAVDDEGMVADALERALRGGADAVIVTPRAQNPTGAALSEPRARRLRAILRRRPELLLIEDDHASLISGAPYRTLVDPSRQRWAVLRSVAKSLGPDLRVALLASDPATHARVEGRQTIGVRWVSHVLQDVAARLLADRAVQRRLAAAAKTYAERRTALIEELRERGIDAHGASGLNVWIPLRDESATVQALMQRGWAVSAGERYRIKSPTAIRVTIATLTEMDAVRLADDLVAALRAGARTSAA